MYLIIHPCYYIGFNDDVQLSEDDQDRSEHVRVTNSLKISVLQNVD